jgi:hypothetical protein
VHGRIGLGDVQVLDDEEQLGRLWWRGAPGEGRGEILPPDPFAGVFSRDRFSLLEALTRHGQQLWSLQFRKIPGRMGVSGSAISQKRAEAHWRSFNMSRISAVGAVSPSLGKMRSMLFAWAVAAECGSQLGGLRDDVIERRAHVGRHDFFLQVDHDERGLRVEGCQGQLSLTMMSTLGRHIAVAAAPAGRRLAVRRTASVGRGVDAGGLAHGARLGKFIGKAQEKHRKHSYP